MHMSIRWLRRRRRHLDRRLTMGQKSSRRKFLRKLATGLPALAAGGALAHTGVLVAKGKNGSKFPGDPAVWRSKFLEEAQAERGAGAAVDTIAATVRPPGGPLVMDIRPGAGPMISRAAEGGPQQAEILG